MASPQLEKGHTRIANEIIEHLVQQNLGGAEFRVCLFVVRQIYGWKGRKETTLGAEKIQSGTNLHRVTVLESLSKLTSKNILLRPQKPTRGNPSTWTFNKDWESWNKVAKRLPNKNGHSGSQMATSNQSLGSQMATNKVADRLPHLSEMATSISDKSLNPKGHQSPKAISKAIKAKSGAKAPGGKPPASARPPDPAYETFSSCFSDKLGAPYMPIDGDFVNLAKLRKALKIGSRDIPPDWNKACRNYLRSPLGKYTLCDLVSRYAVLKNSALDRFGKPEDAHKPDIFETMLAECGEENAGQKRICN